MYDLVGVTNHMGSMSGGHYTARCRVQPHRVQPHRVQNSVQNSVQTSVQTSVQNSAPRAAESALAAVGSSGGVGAALQNGLIGTVAPAADTAPEQVASQWNVFNDKRVSECNSTELDPSSAYILFYALKE